MSVCSPYPQVEIPATPVPNHVMSTFQQRPDKIALIDGDTGDTMTYGELGDRIVRFAAGMQARGLRKGQVVSIFSPNHPDYAVVFHGIALAGGVITTANPLYTPRELQLQLRDSGARWLFSHASQVDVARSALENTLVEELFAIGAGADCPSVDELLGDSSTLQPADIDPIEDLLVLPYSSGTTGLPKGVMLSHSNLNANLAQIHGVTDVELIGERDVILGVLPFYHIYGMTVIMNYGLWAGATIVTMGRFDLEKFLSHIQTYRVTRVNVVPPIVVALGKHALVDDYDLTSLLSVFSGAAPLGDDLANEVRARLNCDVLQGYGLTETSPVTHCSPSNPEVLSSIGSAIPNTECRIVDVETGLVLDSNQSGELHVRGPQVMRGYLNNAEATANTIDDEGWLKTGDLAYFDEQHRFFIVDRVKELIKYNAYQVAPAELEGLLLGHLAVADVAVVPVPDDTVGQIPKAYVVRNENEVSDTDLMDWLAERVAPQKRVRMVEFVESIPKSASGKILRRELIDRERALASEGKSAN